MKGEGGSKTLKILSTQFMDGLLSKKLRLWQKILSRISSYLLWIPLAFERRVEEKEEQEKANRRSRRTKLF